MMDTTDDYKQAKEAKLPTESLAAGRLGLYDSFKAVTGLGEPTIKALQEKEVGGLLKWVFGKGSPKFGGFQRSVVGGKLDVTGRAVVDIDPELRIDEVGLPEGQAWGLYKDFTIRKLAQAGMPVFQATKEVVNKTDRAKEMMKRVMAERPLIMTRAPALHKFSVMAFKPKMIEGHTLMVNPVVAGPFNLDVDGDQVTYYVPVSKKAVKDAYAKMMPSKNLLSARNFTAHYMPQEEYILGAYLSTRKGTGPVKRTFKTEQEAIQAYKRGEIDVNDNVQITG
jgi:DNA-directed RNA polymerase subunit beta'